VPELDQEQVPGGERFFHGLKEPFLPEAAAGAPAERVVVYLNALPHIAGKRPSPSPERGLIVLDGGIADQKNGRHQITGL
jgi:hypothetical protein